MTSNTPLNILSKSFITINNMNTNSENTEKYAWVDAELENCALQEQREYEDQAMDIEEEYEDNPEWNEDTYMEHCINCNAEFETDRQLGYHQMVCKPGNNILCADFLERPPPLTRQNACPLVTVVDEITGNIIWVEEEQDDALYECKHANQLWAPIKKKKTMTYDAYEPIPMEICDDEDREDYMSENDKLEPRELFPNDDEDDLLSVMSDIEVETLGSDDFDRLQFRRGDEVDPHADLQFPVFDEDGTILPIPMDIEEPMLDLGPRPVLVRAYTQWQDPVTGQTVYNMAPPGGHDDLIPDSSYDDIIIT
jgi:hypothetical protein